jgi:hypothetical protein
MNGWERQQQRYGKWFNNRTPQEEALAAEATCLEPYFADLQLSSKAIAKRLLAHEEQSLDGQWVTVDDDPPEETSEGLMDWIFRFRNPLRDRRSHTELAGLCEPERKTILIRGGLPKTEHRAVLLHEMIHAHESQLRREFAEWLVVDLYCRVSRRLLPRRRLHRYIDISTHTVIHEVHHGVLFLLKSLDLDLRFRWKPGTVFGYARKDYFTGVK